MDTETTFLPRRRLKIYASGVRPVIARRHRRIVATAASAEPAPPRSESMVPLNQSAKQKGGGLWQSYKRLKPWQRFGVSAYFCACGFLVTWVADDGTLFGRRQMREGAIGAARAESTDALATTSSAIQETMSITSMTSLETSKQPAADDTTASRWAVVRFVQWAYQEAAQDWRQRDQRLNETSPTINSSALKTDASHKTSAE